MASYEETLPLFANIPRMPHVVDWKRVDALTVATAVGRLFHLLTDGDWHSSVEISGPMCAGLGYGACLSDLRKMGVVPESRYHRNAAGEKVAYYDYRLPEDIVQLWEGR